MASDNSDLEHGPGVIKSAVHVSAKVFMYSHCCSPSMLIAPDFIPPQNMSANKPPPLIHSDDSDDAPRVCRAIYLIMHAYS